MNVPSPDDPGLQVQVASVLSLGRAMRGWDTDSSSGIWTPEPQGIRSDLPPLRLRGIHDQVTRIRQSESGNRRIPATRFEPPRRVRRLSGMLRATMPEASIYEHSDTR